VNRTDEWYDVERVTDRSWRIAEGTIFGSYLIEGDDRALLIDAGIGIGDLRGMAAELTDLPVTLLLSHAHWDHVGNASQFDEVLADGREHENGRVEVSYIGYHPSEWIADWQSAGREFPDEFDPDGYEIGPVTGIETVAPDEEIDLGGVTVELLPVPGHSPGQLAVLDREQGVLYGGDVFHRNHGLYVHFEGCSVESYVDTFDRLIGLWDAGAFDTVYISHERPLSGEDLSLLETFRDGLDAVLADDLEYEQVDDGTGTPARRYEIAGYPVLTKPDIV